MWRRRHPCVRLPGPCTVWDRDSRSHNRIERFIEKLKNSTISPFAGILTGILIGTRALLDAMSADVGFDVLPRLAG